jgi:tetratricopeptide (TPR) repeat protein
MWIAAGQPGKAALVLDRALTGAALQAEQRGEALLDRARAAEAQNDLKTARAKLNEAGATISADPFYWYFSASLAIREADPTTAKSAIAKALSLAPSDPVVLFEAGHVADFTGDAQAARRYWTQAAALDREGPVGKAAAKAIEMLGVVPTVKSGIQSPK